MDLFKCELQVIGPGQINHGLDAKGISDNFAGNRN